MKTIHLDQVRNLIDYGSDPENDLEYISDVRLSSESDHDIRILTFRNNLDLILYQVKYKRIHEPVGEDGYYGMNDEYLEYEYADICYVSSSETPKR